MRGHQQIHRLVLWGRDIIASCDTSYVCACTRCFDGQMRINAVGRDRGEVGNEAECDSRYYRLTHVYCETQSEEWIQRSVWTPTSRLGRKRSQDSPSSWPLPTRSSSSPPSSGPGSTARPVVGCPPSRARTSRFPSQFPTRSLLPVRSYPLRMLGRRY